MLGTSSKHSKSHKKSSKQENVLECASLNMTSLSFSFGETNLPNPTKVIREPEDEIRGKASHVMDRISSLLAMLDLGPSDNVLSSIAKQIGQVSEVVTHFSSTLQDWQEHKLVQNLTKVSRALNAQLKTLTTMIQMDGEVEDLMIGVKDMLIMYKSSLDCVLDLFPGDSDSLPLISSANSSTKRKRQHSDWGLPSNKACPDFVLPQGFIVAHIEAPNPNIQEDLPRKRRRTESTNSNISLPTTVPKLELKPPAKNHRVMAWKVPGNVTLDNLPFGELPPDLTRLGTGYARLVSPSKQDSKHRLVWVKDENPLSPVVDISLEKRVLVRQGSLPWLPDDDHNVLIVTTLVQRREENSKENSKENMCSKNQDDLFMSPRTGRPVRKAARANTAPADFISPKPKTKKSQVKWIAEETILLRAFDVQKADDLKLQLLNAGIVEESRSFGKSINV